MKSIMDSFGTEKWKKISQNDPQYKKDYFVSNFGRVVSKHKVTGRENLMNFVDGEKGYKYVYVTNEKGKRGYQLVHKLVAKAFGLPKNEEEIYVTHKDGNRSNNQLSNLKYITQEEVLNKTLRKYKRPPGKPAYSKLTIMQVKRLKLQLKRGNIRKAQLARMYKVSDTQINRIESGENWGHIKV